MKKLLWPLIHNFEYNPHIRRNWGFICPNYKSILNVQSSEKSFILEEERKKLLDRIYYDADEFKLGAKNGYYVIMNSYYNNVNFLDYCYTTPKLSIALNQIRLLNIVEKPNIDFSKVDIKILDSTIEYGNVEMNSKILGLWDFNYMKSELITGAFGPEAQELWNKKPIRQNIKVLYSFENRIDIFLWQRCLNNNDSPWVVSNINNVILPVKFF